MTIERENAFDFRGPKTLIGPELKAGDPAPNFVALSGKLEDASLADFAGKPLLISAVPSLDTGVCTKQSVRFNQAAAELGDAVAIVTISADLPFGQARWCGANDASSATFLSDHREMSFADAYGVHIKGVRLLSRAVFVIDGEGVIRYVEYLPVAGQEPNYDAALAALKELL
jgi:thiol peroxidase